VVQKRKAGPPGAVGVLQQKIFGIPVDRKFLFSDHEGVYKKKVEKRQRKLIIKISFLKPFLENGEKVLLVTSGHSPVTLFESMGVGWLFVYLKRCLLVFTDRRIFHVPTTPIYRYRSTLAQIPYGSCQMAAIKGNALAVTYKASGLHEKFFSIAGKEKKKIAGLLKKVAAVPLGHFAPGRSHLCPRCGETLALGRFHCERCGLKFKTGLLAAILGILLPGGAYFYLRQYFLGVVAAVVELVLIAAALMSLQDVQKGIESAYWWLVPAAFLLVAVKTLAVIHARTFVEEFVPAKKDVTFQSTLPATRN
jgi:hypothetical protein